MNCLFILLLLCCCGQNGCGCGNTCGNSCGNACAGARPVNRPAKNCGCSDGPVRTAAAKTCGCAEAVVGGATAPGQNSCGCGPVRPVPPVWPDDCPCDNVPPLRPEPRAAQRNNYPNISRGETCGCEE